MTHLEFIECFPTPHHAHSGHRSAPPDRPVLPGTSAHIVRLLPAVSNDHDDGHARSLHSRRIACSLPLLAPCSAACSSLLTHPYDDRQLDSGSRPLLSVAYAACQVKRSVCICQGSKKISLFPICIHKHTPLTIVKIHCLPERFFWHNLR